MGGFGVLKRVDVRELWPKEASDFTPWLAQNLSLLGEVLGMDLELVLIEAPVGAFSLDLLVRDVGGNRTVVIENQIGPTDHDHLGKLLTYAAGHEAAVAVWIAASFREEHRQALDWLNGRSDATMEFFGVVVEALQIDESRLACNFRPVAFPNDWRKAKVPTTGGGPTPKGQAHLAFFQELVDRLRTQYAFTKAQKGQPQNWYYFTSGLNGLSYGVTFALGGKVRVEAVIERPDAAWNSWMFDQLRAERSTLEANFGEVLEWEPLEGKQSCRIAVYRPGSIDEAPALAEIMDWAIQRLLRLKAVVGKRALALAAAGGPTLLPAAPPADPLIT